jgi:hypothetical protein
MWILRVLENGGRNLRLDQTKFIDGSPLSRDSAFTFVAAWELVGWLTET